MPRSSPTRELSVSHNEIIHPEHHNGRSIWCAPEVRDIVDRLHNGDATCGWAGDPRLALYRANGRRWELWRLEANGEMSLVCRSRKGLALDNRLIMHLVAHDTRRGYDVAAEVDRHNDTVQRHREADIADRWESAADKVLWHLRREVGHHY